jgi:mannosyltransferase OCH1-like enzyme
MLRFLQTRSDLYRLALLHAHGGVYIDASTIITDNFSWIENIARFPSQFIFNRYG